MLIGSPAAAGMIFTQLIESPDDANILTVLSETDADLPGAHGSELREIIKQAGMPVNVGYYQHWCPVLARYSFHTTIPASRQPQA